jgi:hypothetical protein
MTQCPRCGEYETEGKQADSAIYDLTNELKCALSCAARQASEAGQRLQITESNAADLAVPHLRTRVVDNIDKLLQLIAIRSKRPGGAWTDLNIESDLRLIDCHSAREFVYYLDWAQAGGFIDPYENENFRGQGIHLSLTMKGWDRVQPLPRPGGIPGRCFVAMWFSDNTRAAYEGGIEPAISQAGFNPIRIDMKEHNNEIPDEIIAEIRNCQFMVADFTGQRAGVYYEAGFAMGLGRPVIWCCRNDEVGKLHFDTNHENHIGWETPEELKTRLYRRIRATILEQA